MLTPSGLSYRSCMPLPPVQHRSAGRLCCCRPGSDPGFSVSWKRTCRHQTQPAQKDHETDEEIPDPCFHQVIPARRTVTCLCSILLTDPAGHTPLTGGLIHRGAEQICSSCRDDPRLLEKFTTLFIRMPGVTRKNPDAYPWRRERHLPLYTPITSSRASSGTARRARGGS